MAGRWIGQRGPREWAPRSPDLTIPDFFLWGYLKSRVYNSKPKNIQELMDNIRDACRLITPESSKIVAKNGKYESNIVLQMMANNSSI